MLANFRGANDQIATTEELEHIATLLPAEWLAPSAPGTSEQCARKILGQFDLGADGVTLHGASPKELAPIVAAYRNVRPAPRFDRCAANPGGKQLA